MLLSLPSKWSRKRRRAAQGKRITACDLVERLRRVAGAGILRTCQITRQVWNLPEKGRNRDKTWASLVAQWSRIRLPTQESQVQSLGQEDPLEKGMTTHSRILV